MDKVKSLAKQKLKEFEGDSDEVYQDSKGIDTVGAGLALRSPTSKSAFSDLGYNVDDIKSGQVSVPREDLDSAMDNVLTQKYDLLNNIKEQSFPKKNLNDEQQAALLSLVFNSPELLGPNLRQYLNEDKDVDVMREIVLNSNKEGKPGVLFRRLQEAELYGGQKGFDDMLSTMSEQEKNIVFNTLNQTKNEQQKQKMMGKYPQFAPSYVPKEALNFYKIPKLFKGK